MQKGKAYIFVITKYMYGGKMSRSSNRIITFKISPKLLEKIDELTEKWRELTSTSYSRSDFIREALRHYTKIMESKIKLMQYKAELEAGEYA